MYSYSIKCRVVRLYIILYSYTQITVNDTMNSTVIGLGIEYYARVSCCIPTLSARYMILILTTEIVQGTEIYMLTCIGVHVHSVLG